MAWKIIIIGIFPLFSIQWKNINHWIISLSEYHSQASDHTQRSCGCLEWSSVSLFDGWVTLALCDGKPPGWPQWSLSTGMGVVVQSPSSFYRSWSVWPREYGSSDDMWFLSSHKQACGFLCSHKQACGFPFVSFWLLVLRKQLTLRPPMETSSVLHDEERRPPDNSHVSHLESRLSSPSQVVRL